MKAGWIEWALLTKISVENILRNKICSYTKLFPKSLLIPLKSQLGGMGFSGTNRIFVMYRKVMSRSKL